MSKETIDYINFFDKTTGKNILDYFPEFTDYVNIV